MSEFQISNKIKELQNKGLKLGDVISYIDKISPLTSLEFVISNYYRA